MCCNDAAPRATTIAALRREVVYQRLFLPRLDEITFYVYSTLYSSAVALRPTSRESRSATLQYTGRRSGRCPRGGSRDHYRYTFPLSLVRLWGS